MALLRRSSLFVLFLAASVALGVVGCGDDDSPSAPTADETAPAIPSGVAAIAVIGDLSQVRVSWNANETDADLAGYVVYRSDNPDGNFRLAAMDPVQTNSFVDGAVAKGGTYYYRVAARDASANESAMSEMVGVTIDGSSGTGDRNNSDGPL